VFRDRDLFLLGAGALLASLCLLLPLPFAGKLLAGVLTLFGFMALALLRLGPDRVPAEEWLLRRLRYRFSPRRFVYHRADWKPARRPVTSQEASHAPASAGWEPGGGPFLWPGRGLGFTEALALPGSESCGSSAKPNYAISVYPLATVLLGLLGVRFVAWLAGGGAQEIAALFR
jgi:hypothetical protein